MTRVPVLGKIPVLGALFRHKARRGSSELVVYITLRVLGTAAPPGGDPADPPAAPPGALEPAGAAAQPH